MCLILTTGEARFYSIRMETSAGHPIENSQPTEITQLDRSSFAQLAQNYSAAVERAGPSPKFNCHGLTFGSRRAKIWKSEDIARILNDDGYIEVPEGEALPGDVIVYFNPDDNDYWHSGIVVSPAEQGSLGRNYVYPKIVSKWGTYKEMIHFANNSPYSIVGAKYYRVRR